jgi:molybdopterin-guanine dinucleotide biosynthesis protein MobB
LRGNPEPPVDELIARMSPVDLVLVEGYKRGDHPKLEIYRASLGKTLLAPEDASIVAIASDAPVAGSRLPFFALSDIEAIAEFIIAHCRIEAVEDGAAQR